MVGIAIQLVCFANKTLFLNSFSVYFSRFSVRTIAQKNQQTPMGEDLSSPADALIVQVDGGHIPTKDRDKRSFEALAGVVYQPNNLEVVDKHHRRITNKSCAISALDDELQTIKTYVHNAALRQGLNAQTQVTGLADGASNCWSVILALKPHCQMPRVDFGLVSHR